MPLIFAIFAAAFDVLAAVFIWRGASVRIDRWLAAAAVLLHAGALTHQVFHGGSITIGVNEAVSLFAWQSAFLLWAFCWKEPLRGLGLFIYPFAGFCAVWAALWPTAVSGIPITDWTIRTHIVLSLFSAGVLTLAAVQAGALALQDQLLHDPQRGRVLLGLPPLQTMERLLFQLIGVGFFLLSLTLLTGFWFIQDWLAQHLAHKTVLSIIAWLIFGILLWGRWRYGWRGRTAIRWALSGYGVLILAYFGSKLILEQILGKHWT
jgi:ABC-type uncharacterized transport system permease subunit